MCGIGGWFSRSPRHEHGAKRLVELTEALKHRGPDAVAALELDHVGMAHTRLAMIDLVSGDQPMWSADRRVVIVLNGEIFNYRELRADYEARGARFASQSDTEVVLAGYQIEGSAVFGRLRGMYAIALWDVLEQRALLARDPLGIKPLFMHEDRHGTLSFASEAKGLLSFLDGLPTLDEAALHLLLNFRYVPGDATLFRTVRQLDPGQCVEWRPASGWRATRIVSSLSADTDDLESVLVDSVRAHLVADVPVGCYLSGGIDSGLIAAFARHLGADPPTFTLAVGDDPAEARNAAETARILGLRNTQAALGDDEVQRLPRMLWHLETPKVNSVQLFRLAELARTEAKAALSGLGGDELFAGYNVHRIFRLASRMPAGTSRLAASAVQLVHSRAAVPFGEYARGLEIVAAGRDWPRAYALLRNIWDRPELRRWLYGPRMLDAPLRDAVDLVRERWPVAEAPLTAMMGFEWDNKMVNDLLWQEDRASMAAGLEVRVPFVDVIVRESVRRLGPPSVGKVLLRKVAAHHLPRQVLQRPKSGFQLDAPAYFETHLRPLARIWLSHDRVRDYGIFSESAVATLLHLPPRKRYRWHFFLLYLMIQTHMWLEIFERGRGHDIAVRP
jgi:asparagine synthase (glutamine-hydrolysing)